MIDVSLGHSPVNLYVGQIVYKIECQIECFTTFLYLNVSMLFKGTSLLLNIWIDIDFTVHTHFTSNLSNF